MTVADGGDETLLQLTTSSEKSRWMQTPRGRGKVVPTSGSTAASSGHHGVPRLTGSTHLEAQHGARENDFRPRYPSDTAGSWLAPTSLDDAAQGYRALKLISSAQPCLMRNAPLVAALQNRWTPQHLVSSITDSHGTCTVLCSTPGRNRFIQCHDASNTFGSFYHVREPESQRLDMPLREFMQCTQKWRSRPLYLKDTIMVHNNCGSAAIGKLSVRVQLDWAEPLGHAFQSELEGRIDWLWLHSLLHAQKHGPVLRLELQAGPPNGLLPARYEHLDRLLAQVNGRRRVLLIPPTQAFHGMYPYPVHHPYDRYSMVDLEAVDAEEWPEFSGVHGSVCILEPGDLLFVPQFWFAHVQFLDQDNTDLTFYLHPGARIRSPDSVPLQVSRLLEERIAEAESIRDVRHWLSLLAADEEEAFIDLDSVQGYKRTVMCEAVRDEVASNLGEEPGTCSQLLSGMVRRRLMPTPWLNQNFREPLYLKDKPVRTEDTRSEEERKYPDLFRQKLQGEGWAVPESQSTVPIPGYNMPKHQSYRDV